MTEAGRRQRFSQLQLLQFLILIKMQMSLAQSQGTKRWHPPPCHIAKASPLRTRPKSPSHPSPSAISHIKRWVKTFRFFTIESKTKWRIEKKINEKANKFSINEKIIKANDDEFHKNCSLDTHSLYSILSLTQVTHVRSVCPVVQLFSRRFSYA